MKRFYDIPESEFSKADTRIYRGGWHPYKSTAKRRKLLRSLTVPLFGSGLRVPGKGQKQNEPENATNLLWTIGEKRG